MSRGYDANVVDYAPEYHPDYVHSVNAYAPGYHLGGNVPVNAYAPGYHYPCNVPADAHVPVSAHVVGGSNATAPPLASGYRSNREARLEMMTKYASIMVGDRKVTMST